MSDYDAEYRKAPGPFGSDGSPLLAAYGHLIPGPRCMLDVGAGHPS